MSEDGDLYTWGKGKTGALGHGNNDDVLTPQKVKNLEGIVKVECGNDYTVVLDDEGRLFTFGNNTYGQLGLVNNVNKLNEPQ